MGNVRDQHQRTWEILLATVSGHENCCDHSQHTTTNIYPIHDKMVCAMLWIVLVRLREKKTNFCDQLLKWNEFSIKYLCPKSAKKKKKKKGRVRNCVSSEQFKSRAYLQCVAVAINFGIFVQKFHANCMKTVFIELIRNESIHKATFANSTVTYNHMQSKNVTHQFVSLQLLT